MERSLKKKRNDNASPVLTELLRNESSGQSDGLPETIAADQDDREVADPVQAKTESTRELKKKWTANGPKVTVSSVSPLFRDMERESQRVESSSPAENKTDNMTENEVDFPAAPEKHEEKPTAALPSEKISDIPQARDAKIVVSGLFKGYVKAKKLIPVLQGIDMTVGRGEYLAISGQSGSGKSTLLHLMGTLDVPDSGTIHLDGQRIDNLPIRKRDYLRNRYIGMIFQFYHLIPEMTTLENVLAPLMIRDGIFQYWRNRRSYHEKAKNLLDLVGLSHRLRHRPGELSGGEMQRASIARALIGDPAILLADEPTGNLDSKTSQEIINLLRGLNEQQKLTIVMVTHDLPQAEGADRIIRLVDGQIV